MKLKMTVGRKLGVSFGVVIALLAVLTWSSLRAVGNLAQALGIAGSQSARKMELSGAINTDESDLAVAERGMILAAVAKDAAAMDKAERQFQDGVNDLKRSAQEFSSLATRAESRDLCSGIERQAEEWRTNFAQVAGLLRAGNLDEATRLSSTKDTPIYESLAKDAEALDQVQGKVNANDVAEGAELATTSRWTAIGLGLLAFAVGAVVLWVIRDVNRTLRRLAGALSDGAAQVAGAAGQVSSAGQMLAQGASEQAASLEETSASSEEIATMTSRSAEHSEEAANLMITTSESVDGANRKMGEMVHSMKEITTSSDKISKIIKVIDEIAFQTNILALNAAVEAARAGEAGMGFAVVADEVRNLAQRCARAARDTADLIEESIARSNDGSTRLADVSHAIEEITTQSAKAKLLVDEIHTGSQEQSRGIEQVAGAVAQMQQVTQSTAASAEESAAAGKELAAQAQNLHRLVGDLNALVGKDDSAPQQPSRSASPPRRGSVAGLAALGSAVSRQASGQGPDALRTAARRVFPLDEVFK